MGTLSTQPYDVSEGQQWCDYFDRIISECRRLIAAGRMPDTEALDAFLSDSGGVLRQVRQDVVTARARGEQTTTTQVGLTNEEHKRLLAMSESILNLLQILEMRGAVQLDRSEAVGRVAASIVGGSYTL